MGSSLFVFSVLKVPSEGVGVSAPRVMDWSGLSFRILCPQIRNFVNPCQYHYTTYYLSLNSVAVVLLLQGHPEYSQSGELCKCLCQ